MSKHRYAVTGIPLSPPFDVLAGAKVGDEIVADLDDDVRDLLVGGGALVPLGPVQREQTKKQQPTSKEPDSWRDSASPARTAEAAASERSAPTTSPARHAKDREK